MLHIIYVNHSEFKSVIEEHSITASTFFLDPEVIAGDSVVFIDTETKERTIVEVLYSECEKRLTLTEKCRSISLGTDVKEALVGKQKELEQKKKHYRIEIGKCRGVVNMPMKYADDEINEVVVVCVSENGIFVKFENGYFTFTKSPVESGQQTVFEVTKKIATEISCDEEMLIPLMDYSNKDGEEIRNGRIYLVQTQKKALASLSLVTPSSASKQMISETFGFENVFDRYLFWLLEKLYMNEDIPELEIGIQNEPVVLAEILLNRIECVTDLIYFDYDMFIADNFALYAEPLLTKSELRERTNLIPKNERNYKEIMEMLIYSQPFLDWAMEYDRVRTMADDRVKRLFE